jgi:hypothetical protein
LIAPNPESALNEEAGRLQLEDYEDYAKRAQLMTSIHARSPIGQQLFEKKKDQDEDTKKETSKEDETAADSILSLVNGMAKTKILNTNVDRTQVTSKVLTSVDNTNVPNTMPNIVHHDNNTNVIHRTNGETVKSSMVGKLIAFGKKQRLSRETHFKSSQGTSSLGPNGIKSSRFIRMDRRMYITPRSSNVSGAADRKRGLRRL